MTFPFTNCAASQRANVWSQAVSFPLFVLLDGRLPDDVPVVLEVVFHLVCQAISALRRRDNMSVGSPPRRAGCRAGGQCWRPHAWTRDCAGEFRASDWSLWRVEWGGPVVESHQSIERIWFGRVRDIADALLVRLSRRPSTLERQSETECAFLRRHSRRRCSCASGRGRMAETPHAAYAWGTTAPVRSSAV